MRDEIQQFILKQARRTIRKYHRGLERRRREREERIRRTGQDCGLSERRAADRWQLDRHFNPFYVRSKAACISHAIEKAVYEKCYEPRPSLDVQIAKRGGGHRDIAVYTVPDAAVGNWLYERLYTHNKHRLSEFAFAYRHDRTSNDAVRHLAKVLVGTPRSFVVEYDFENFFDSIDHPYLQQILDRYFDIGAEEMAVLHALLVGQSASKADYEKGFFKRRQVGIPQGNSISLFLANAVFKELDDSLTNLGVTFARYADDLAVVARSYVDACNAADVILRWSETSKITINQKKSDGISLLTAHQQPEIKSKRSITFLGCDIDPVGVRPGERRIKRLKAKLALAVYRQLVQAPRKGTFNPERIQAGVDLDLAACIRQIRRILYGRLSDSEITDGLGSNAPYKPIRSSMSGLAVVDAPDRFKELDGWLVGVLERACSMRAALVSQFGVQPIAVTRRKITTGSWCQDPKVASEMRLPSAYRVWLYMRMISLNYRRVTILNK